MQTYRVALGDRSYPIHIGSRLIDDAALFAGLIRGKRAAVVTNETVGPLYADRLSASLAQSGIETVSVVLPDGEDHKNWVTLGIIYDAMLSHRCDRQTTLIALGGGVVGDMTGFAAATFMRGVPYIQVPTTLLAQVDSSVGGKTAINHPLGKNMIGAFYQPVGVVADMDTLRSLPERELRAGLAEVIKHGLIRDPGFFEWLEVNLPRLLARAPDALAHAVMRSVEIKGEFVAIDEREAGPRALLNFGHTFGHAIEAGLGFGSWLHGEAVAAGMVMAGDLSRRLGHLSAADYARVRDIIVRSGLPAAGPKLSPARYLELMTLDKKTQAGRLRLILLERVGAAYIAESTAPELLNQTLTAIVA